MTASSVTGVGSGAVQGQELTRGEIFQLKSLLENTLSSTHTTMFYSVDEEDTFRASIVMDLKNGYGEQFSGSCFLRVLVLSNPTDLFDIVFENDFGGTFFVEVIDSDGEEIETHLAPIIRDDPDFESAIYKIFVPPMPANARLRIDVENTDSEDTVEGEFIAIMFPDGSVRITEEIILDESPDFGP